MSRHLVFLIIFILIFSNLRAQEGNNALSLNGEGAISKNDPGLGFYIKGLYGIGNSAQLTLSAGISKFKVKSSIEKKHITTRLIPFLLGYRQNIQQFFIEPAIGFGELGGKITTDGDYSRPSVGAVFAGLGAGYTIKRINVGLSFLAAKGIENSSAGIWHDKDFHYTSIFVGYNLFTKKL